MCAYCISCAMYVRYQFCIYSTYIYILSAQEKRLKTVYYNMCIVCMQCDSYLGMHNLTLYQSKAESRVCLAYPLLKRLLTPHAISETPLNHRIPQPLHFLYSAFSIATSLISIISHLPDQPRYLNGWSLFMVSLKTVPSGRVPTKCVTHSSPKMG